MMRIALTQRVVTDVRTRERRDALDQRWIACLAALDVAVVPVPNALVDPAAWAHALCIDGLLLSGGNDLVAAPAGRDVAPERDRTESGLLDAAGRAGWPVLGVCRGLQMMNVHLGGRVSSTSGHAGSYHSIYRTAHASRWFDSAWERTPTVNSYHDYGIGAGELAPGCVALYQDSEGRTEAFEHERLPWLGIMWHPEREPDLTVRDHQLLARLFHTP